MTARAIFARNTSGWDHTCRGGLCWTTARNYKNAISTELFLTLAALLHQRVPADGSYLTWARRAWEWFRASRLIGPGGLVNDGLTSACVNNGLTTWTYNQGVILGGLAALCSPSCAAWTPPGCTASAPTSSTGYTPTRP